MSSGFSQKPTTCAKSQTKTPGTMSPEFLKHKNQIDSHKTNQ